ncbi:MAG: isoprenoid biosynthesis glyoxalase ElbB, partial [Phycisphaerales bacterium]|nr:isoprenoid biosynthesis glyoxalase ElbB [Phycisphaerales bacterium]
HARGVPSSETRNILVESARIARGEITPLADLDPTEYDAIVVPGGFGAAKNLCTYAFDGPDCTVDPDVQRVLEGARTASIPIGLCCIAPVLASRVFGLDRGCTVTIGHDEATASHVASMGATHQPCDIDEVCVDESNRIVTTPAYMLDAPIHEVFDGIGRMIERVLDFARQPA